MTHTKPVRLDLLAERRDARGWLKQNAVYVIRDGSKRISTGCGADDVKGAQRKLREYLAEQEKKGRTSRSRPAEDVPIGDVLEYYLERSGDVARPKELKARIDRLSAWWRKRTLADISGHTCEEYAAHRGSAAGARRELEDLSAAIALYARNGLCRERVVVTLPKKSDPREAHFTRDEIARLIRFCRSYRTTQRGRKTKHHSLRHIVPHILTSVYTGTRSFRVWNASYEREPGRPWLDLENGIYYRIGEAEPRYDNKRADPIPIPERLRQHMLRWQRGRKRNDGVFVPRRFLVEWQGRAADPRKALRFAMEQVFGEDHGFVQHSFRHTCATWLLWEGAHSEEEIAAYLSMTVQMLRKVYGHPHPDRHRRIAESFTKGSAGRRQRNPRGNRYGRGGGKDD